MTGFSEASRASLINPRMTKLRTTQFRFRLGTATDVGKVRILNEDYFTVDPDVGLFIVADGVGGQNAGEVASQMAVEIGQNYVMSPQVPVTSVYSDVLPPAANRMVSGIQFANAKIYEASQRRLDQLGMATTIASVYIHGHIMALAHVGDSRIYRMRGEDLQCLTVDHSLIAAQLQHGLITELEVAASTYKHVITRALGAQETVCIDANEDVVLDHDRILLCTDGLTNMVKEENIAQIILDSKNDPQKACEALVNRANANGGRDNITVILIHCEKGQRHLNWLLPAAGSFLAGMRAKRQKRRSIASLGLVM